MDWARVIVQFTILAVLTLLLFWRRGVRLCRSSAQTVAAAPYQQSRHESGHRHAAETTCKLWQRNLKSYIIHPTLRRHGVFSFTLPFIQTAACQKT